MPGELGPSASPRAPWSSPPVPSSASPPPHPTRGDTPSPATGASAAGGRQHSSIAEFMQSPMLVIPNLDVMKVAGTPPPPREDTSLLQDLQELRRRVGMAQEEVYAQRRAVAELEAQVRSGKTKVLTQLYSDLSTPPPHAVGKDAPGGNAEVVDGLLVSVQEQLLCQVRKLEEETAMCRLNNSAKEEALRALYAGILMEEKNQEERGRELRAEETVCNTLRLKLQEAQRRVWDYRRRELFVSAAERKYLEQMESIHSLRAEVRECGLRLPVLEVDGDVTGAAIPTCNRFRWEQHCARRLRAVKRPPSLETEGVCFGSKPMERGVGKGEEEDEDDPNATVSRVFAFPPGTLRSLHQAMCRDAGEGAAGCGGHLHCSVRSAAAAEREGGSRGLRQRARALGLSLQYQQHLEANPYLSRSSAGGGGVESEKGASAASNGMEMVIRGQRRAVDQFQRELESAVAALQSSDGADVYFRDFTSPDAERLGGRADTTHVGGAASVPRCQRRDGRPVTPWRAAAELAQLNAAAPSPRRGKDTGEAADCAGGLSSLCEAEGAFRRV
ncbi:uncharacterized protein Tco025E_07299 [Trypanosoma conorhini]|uniref:Uncharacterized protein n=1 Tax=Trypanosoma conorhini TaxID=83891 RepID=A0A3R7KHH1_9TRYP|nr:uncharacterized protein Tco025E_07299 [Trypanosoma conorhini]RNF07761.1 hypothetical protein Tco025E_07299 [Trypanosoma conorhini]